MASTNVLFLLLLGVVAADLVDDYEALIKDEIKRTETYQFPKSADDYRPSSNKMTDYGVYDYVVVGGGSAGSVVASRLSEMENTTVLLLEAGGEETNFTDIPSMSIYTSQLEYNWGFNSTPQDTCCIAMGGVCPFPRGRSLGGTSVINALIYVRGNRADYDKWGKDNPGWSYNDVLPFFMRSENATAITGEEEDYHGYSGPLVVEHHHPSSKKLRTFLDGNVEIGRQILDYNGKEQHGANQMQFTTVEGRRESSAKAFLRRARMRKNLKVVTNAYVTKVLVSNVTKTVYGVVFAHAKKYYVVKVRKEVVLSAGVVGSAHILMNSGIGPEEDLERFGIPLVQNLSVGQNMHDHLTFFNNYYYTTHKEPSYDLRDAIKQYLKGEGPLTISTNPQGVSFFHLGLNVSTSPDIEMVFVPSVNMNGFDAFKTGIVHGHVDEDNVNYWNNQSDGIHDDDSINYWSRSLDNNIFQFVIVLLHPKTRGEVVLQSRDPFTYPLIKSRCLVDPDDIEKVYEGVKKITRLVYTKAFQKLQPVLLGYPRCIQFRLSSEEYWKCVIRNTAMNAYHGGGTCKMGSNPDEGAVVDNKLKVYGVKGLRVADTSVIPITLAAHMNAPAMMIGERCAEFIKNENNY